MKVLLFFLVLSSYFNVQALNETLVADRDFTINANVQFTPILDRVENIDCYIDYLSFIDRTITKGAQFYLKSASDSLLHDMTVVEAALLFKSDFGSQISEDEFVKMSELPTIEDFKLYIKDQWFIDGDFDYKTYKMNLEMESLQTGRQISVVCLSTENNFSFSTLLSALLNEGLLRPEQNL